MTASSSCYRVDLESVRRHMCPGLRVPPLLGAFAKWIERRPWGAVGYFNVRGDRLPDGYVDGAADVAAHLGFFVHLPEGSLVGFWRPRGDEKDPAVVLLGSEGELEVAARSLPEFLWRIALSKFDSGGPLDELLPPRDDDDDEPIADQRAELAAWLKKRGLRPPTKSALAATSRARPDFRKWLEAHGARERRVRKRVPELDELANALRRALPKGAEAWAQSGLEVVFGAGNRAALRRYPPFTGAGEPRAPLPERDEERFSALVRAVRTEDAARHPERGPCVSLLVLASTERLSLVREYLTFPEDAWHGFTRAEIVRGVQEHARSAYWLPDWAFTKP